MSKPQQSGDLIFPHPAGHSDIWTSLPSSVVRVPSTSGSSHFPQLVLTDMPQELHLYIAILFPPKSYYS